jgi:hypothetical protein
MIEMQVTGETPGTRSLHLNAMHPDAACVRIDAVTALKYCSGRGVGTVHVLKCDTEGHDLEVLLGALELFDEQRIVVCQLEYNHRWIYLRVPLSKEMVGTRPVGFPRIEHRGVETENTDCQEGGIRVKEHSVLLRMRIKLYDY